MYKKILTILLAILVVLGTVTLLTSCEAFYEGFQQGVQDAEQSEEPDEADDSADQSDGSQDADQGAGKSSKVKKDGTYNSKEDVAEYLSIYKKLPKNYIKKSEAKKLGWSGGSVERVAPGKAIGGDSFGNYEKKLPVKKNRKYYECDIDTLGKKKRGPKRIIYSDDGLIYYTGDHYKTFSKMPQSA